MRAEPAGPSLRNELGLLILRVMLAGLILFHGIDKVVHGIAWMQRPLGALHLPFFLAYGTYVGEVLAPLLVLAGIFTRTASLLIAINMIMALVLEAGRSILTIQRTGAWGIELEAFYLLSAIVVALLGPDGSPYRLLFATSAPEGNGLPPTGSIVIPMAVNSRNSLGTSRSRLP